ncbi:hypothetical protein [Microcoleus sp. D3_18a_C4]|uniref:hypothetical protein n=1 Tax=Microcoleus sp. D3_18a_C4 TaxID=3055332 RepID=UPI002FCF909F
MRLFLLVDSIGVFVEDVELELVGELSGFLGVIGLSPSWSLARRLLEAIERRTSIAFRF